MFMQAGNDDERERVIDENLKRVYQEALEEGVPDRFKELLNQLKRQDSSEGFKK